MNYRIIDLPEIKLLSDEETKKYIELARQGDDSALEKVVKHNLKLVLKVTYRFKNYGYDLEDLFQTGVIGLIKAVKGFDLSRKNKFSTYAVARIIGEIRVHIRDDEIIKVSRSLKKIAGEIRELERMLKGKLNRQPTINEIIDNSDYTREEIIRALEASRDPTSLSAAVYEDEGEELTLLDSLVGKVDSDSLNKIALINQLKKLDNRARKIIFMRYFQDLTQTEIAEKLGISQVQVSRLEKKIIQELRQKLKTR